MNGKMNRRSASSLTGITNSLLTTIETNSIQSGDLGTLRYRIDRGDDFGDGVTVQYGSIISDNTNVAADFKVSNQVTTTRRTAGLTSINGTIDRITFPTLNTTGHTLFIASSDANDTAAGSGAQRIFVQYVDNSWNPQSVYITLNGQTAVSFANAENFGGTTTPVTNIYRINRMMISDVGASQTNEGAVTITTTSDHVAGVPQTDIVNAIDNGYSYSAVAIFSTTNNMRLYFTRGSYYTDSNATRALGYTQYSTFPWSTSTPDINRSRWYVGDLTASTNAAFNTSGSAPEFPNTDIEFVAFTASSVANANIFWNTLRVTDTNNF